jgi:hypothetical protein
VARLDSDVRAVVGKTIQLAADTSRMHYFDGETGQTIV